MGRPLARVISALGRGVASQFAPRMLALLVLPFLVAIAFWILSGWFLWDPVTGWFQVVLFQGDGWMARGYRQLSPYGLSGLSTWVPNLFAFLLLVPIAIASALALIAVLAMPMVIRHLGAKTYPEVARHGSLALGANLWNVLKSVVIFVVGYLATLPLWLIPPLALIVPWLWWGWLTARLMRFDSLVEHASLGEREALIRSDRRTYMLLGLSVAA
ncbi:MAG TPA: EI24 domain-containing protein, partial [Lautropia sp.]|nr:EI24 domain-containing protein [Lautropia sp.]